MKILSDSMKAYLSCVAACEQCVTGCLNEGHAMSCCKICRDCADLCNLCFILESRHSPYLEQLKPICATVCTDCAEECNKHAGMLEHCKICAEKCLECLKVLGIEY